MSEMMYNDYMNLGWGGMLLGPIMMLLFLGLFIAFIILIIKWAGGLGSAGASRERTALDILEERYAAGEIDHDEFEERRKALRR